MILGFLNLLTYVRMRACSSRRLLSALFLFGAGVLAVSAFAAKPLLAEDVQVTAVFDKKSAQVGEEIRLTIRIAGAQGNIQAPRLPSYKSFDTYYTGRASHISFVNGVSSSNVDFSFTLIPKAAGHFKLDPIEVSVNGRRFATDPVDLDITGSANSSRPSYTSQNAPFNPNAMPTRLPPSNSVPASAPAGPSGAAQNDPAPSFVPDDDNIFVRSWADKTSVYPNEQILLTYSLYTRYDTRYEGFDKEPQVSGFWIEEFPMEKDVRRETVTLNGKRYVKADIRLMGLFPTTPADYTIDPGVLKASIRKEQENSGMFDEFFNDSFFSGGGFFGRRENRLLKPAPIHITVKPFPEQGKPDGFQGAVGNFKISAFVDKTTVKQNEPVNLKLVIEGEGNIETLNKPKIPELKDFKTYDSDASTQLSKNGNVIGGRKTFEIIFIPLKSGQLLIPSLSFSYFNPAKASYVNLKTPEFRLTVTPSETPFQMPKGISLPGDDGLKKDVTVQSRDIRYIWERLPSQNRGFYTDVFSRILMALDAALALLVVAGMIRRRQDAVYASDIALKRRKNARANAEKGMKGLRKKNERYFDEAEKILSRYLSDKFTLSTHGMTRYELDDQLRNALGDDDPLLQDIRGFYSVCDESRFGKGEIPESLKQKALSILKETITRVEKMRRR